MLWLVWLLVSLIGYAYVGYPVLIWLLGRVNQLHRTLPASPPRGLSVCIVVAAYNEERVIAEKLDTLLRQTYPRHLTEIMVVDDGSSDATRTIVSAYKGQGVKLIALPRGGKAAALNRAILDCKARIMAFTDADTLWLPETLLHLLAPFTDRRVGGVAGHIAMRRADARGLGDRAYRAYETFIRRAETRACGCTAADGGLFAIRRALAEPVPSGVTDDFFLSTGVIARGKSLVYQPRAVAVEKSIIRPSNQYRRRVRITVRGMESLWQRRALMNPLRFGVFAVALFSHKLLRRLAPALALLLFPASAFAMQHAMVYQAMFVTQALLYLVAAVGLLDRRTLLPKPFRIAGFILLGSVGTLVGVAKFLSGVRYAQWIPQKHENSDIAVRSRDGQP